MESTFYEIFTLVGIRNLTRSLRSLVRFQILHQNPVRARFPLSNL